MACAILVVEDSAEIRFCLSEFIRHEGYEVLTASDGVEALEKLATLKQPALVLLDLMMPRIDGWTVLKQMRQSDRLAPIPVIVTSAVADPNSLKGANEIVKKPYDMDSLLSLIRKYCGPPRTA